MLRRIVVSSSAPMPIPKTLCLLAVGLLASLASCVSIEQAAPPVALLTMAATDSRLPLGRSLYLGKCAKCHRPETITDFSREQWVTDILPTMNQKAKLSPSEIAALNSYIFAVLNQPPRI